MISRPKKQQARAQLEAALAGVPAEGCDENVQGMVTLARLLAPRRHPNPAYQDAERAALLLEAALASVGGVDLSATTGTDAVPTVHVREVTLPTGVVVRVADLEFVEPDDAATIAAVLDAKHGTAIRP